MRRLTLLFLTALLTATAVPASAEAAKRAQCLLRKSGPQCYLWTGKVGFIAKGVSPRSVNLHLHKVAHAGAVKVVRPYPLTNEYP